ncbi:ferredoxin [Prauserella sp. PE36]|uniref:Ferredoxin n=1 Tax=Prauserella endophytica TaxID=1592324 RepID=A0ABY2S029_9PSEU|nr:MULTISPECIES: (4Fe-4S)-binding protein [Prauserella]RBM22493.1 ferredoxin [Prauserella sp. PE36]TKG66995.1 ferredoxin [Prauserella endophytica]
MIEADRDICIGAGMCALTAPEVFDQDDDGLVVTLTDEPGPESTDAVKEAVQLCPSGALRLAGS